MIKEVLPEKFDPDAAIQHLILNGGYVFSARAELNGTVSFPPAHKWIHEEKDFSWAEPDPALGAVFDIFEATFISRLFSQFTREKMWYCDGVEIISREWHTDLLEKIDISALIYLSDQTPETGGFIAVRDSNNTGFLMYPKIGDVILLSHKPGFEHRAEPSLVRRLYINSTYRNVRM